MTHTEKKMADPMDVVAEAVTSARKRKEPIESFDEDNECFACMQPYNRSHRSRVKCDYCSYESCRQCHMRYLLDTISDPHCMKCKKPWLDTVLLAKFSKVMVRELWQRKVDFVYQHQRSFMNIAARFMENARRVNDLTREIDQKNNRRRYLLSCVKTSMEYSRLEKQLLSARLGYSKLLDKIEPLTKRQEKEIARLRTERRRLEDAIERLVDDAVKDVTSEITALELERAQLPVLLPNVTSERSVARFRDKAFGYCFLDRTDEPPLLPGETDTSTLFLSATTTTTKVKATDPDQRWNCPAPSCRGVLNTDYKCCVCTKEFCEQCLEEKKANHSCNADHKANIVNIRKTTKPCPKCLTRIFRSSGCDQMWCVNCHTAFDWKTGNEVHGSIHNPLYFEYLNRRNQGADAIDYCQEISPTVMGKIQQLTTLPFHLIYLQYQEIRDGNVIMNSVRNRRDFFKNSANAPVPACYRYLHGSMDEETWKNNISAEMMHERSCREYYAIYQGFLVTIEEALRQLQNAHTSSIFCSASSAFLYLPHPPRYRANMEVVFGGQAIQSLYHYANNEEADEYCKMMRTHYESLVEIIRSTNFALHEVSKAYKIAVPRFLLFNRNNNKEYAQNPFTNVRYRESLLMRVDPVQHVSHSDKDSRRKYTAEQLNRKPRPASQIQALYDATIKSSSFKHSTIGSTAVCIQWLWNTSEAELDLLPPMACRQMRAIMFDAGIAPCSVSVEFD